MNKLSFYIGNWFGTPVTLHWSWTIVFLLLLFLKPEMALLWVALFFIVLMHECGHCIAAKKFNVHPSGIVLYPLGGIASINCATFTPKQDLIITIAGPAVNLFFIPILSLICNVVPFEFQDFAKEVAFVNLAMLIFNLIPAYPLDGGRILRAILMMTMRSKFTAMIIACRVGQFFAAVFVVLGLYVFNIGLMLIGVLVFLAASSEIKMAQVERVKDLGIVMRARAQLNRMSEAEL